MTSLLRHQDVSLKVCSDGTDILGEPEVDLFLGRDSVDDGDSSRDAEIRHIISNYLLKTYNKTGSLMARSCQAVAELTRAAVGKDEYRFIPEAAFAFGRDLGICFQLVDDALDFEVQDERRLGKPTGADLR